MKAMPGKDHDVWSISWEVRNSGGELLFSGEVDANDLHAMSKFEESCAKYWRSGLSVTTKETP